VRHYTDGYYARPKCLRYPGGVAYHYNTAGYLVQEKDASGSYVIRQVSARDSPDEVIAAMLANGALTQSAEFYPAHRADEIHRRHRPPAAGCMISTTNTTATAISTTRPPRSARRSVPTI